MKWTKILTVCPIVIILTRVEILQGIYSSLLHFFIANWVMNFKVSPAQINKGQFDGKSDVQLTISDDDFAAMATGQLNSQKAFLQGKLKIKGNVMLTQKLGQIFSQHAKL